MEIGFLRTLVIIFGVDGTSPEILHKMGIDGAKLLVIAVSDPASTPFSPESELTFANPSTSEPKEQ